MFACLFGSRSADTLFAMFRPVWAEGDIFTCLLLPCNFRSHYQCFSGSSVFLPVRDCCSSQGNPRLALTQPSPPRRKHRQLMLSAPQLQPDLHQIPLGLTSNSHTVYSVHWHFQDLIQGLTVVSLQRLFPLQLQSVFGGQKRIMFFINIE